MKLLRWTLVFGLCVAGAAAVAEEPATAMLRCVPEGTEVVIGVDVAMLSTHPRFDEVFQRFDRCG